MILRLIGIILIVFLAACHKNDAPPAPIPDPYFIKANFNEIPVKFSNNQQFDFAHFGASLKDDKSWRIIIDGEEQELDTVCHYISLTFNYVPNVGRHLIDNSFLNLPSSEPWVTAYMTSYNRTLGNSDVRYGLDGYIDIVSISKEEIKGSFEFHARGNYVNDSSTVTVTAGSFYVKNKGGSVSGNWPGP